MVAVRLDPPLQGQLGPSDVLQEAYLEAAQRLGEYLGGPDLPYHLWLRGLAGNKVPGPESANELTVKLTCEGTVRPLSASSRGRKVGRLRGAEPRVSAGLRFRFVSQEESHMVLPLFEPWSAIRRRPYRARRAD
jgi:hypothetical protein